MVRVVCLLLAFAGCGEQPPPLLGDLSPPVVCGSGILPLALHGDHFLALPEHTLSGEATLAVPHVDLIPASATGTTVSPVVVWLSSQLLSLSVPLDQLATGSYSLSLTDPDGQQARSDGALTRVEVAPVDIVSVSPSPVCLAAADQVVHVGGSGFDLAAVVSVRDASGATVLSPGATLTQSAITVTLPSGSLPPGDYTLVVENPAEAGCQATAAQPLIIDPPPKLTRATPNQVCAAGARLVVTGSGLMSGATVELLDDKVTLTATQVSVMTAKRAIVTFPPNMLGKNGQADLIWTNPDGCSMTLAKAVRVRPGGRGGCN